ncbi:hypothetical protein WJX73_005665 [Symbiochloris irregularis]|uniref:F-box domain-containing protein n=1 Tax=Symbiochloris irregularis TaxID=706552 RepID=A0AAW1P7M9_9CHLO
MSQREKQNRGPIPWSTLPEELRARILHSLPVQSKLRAEQVSQEWRKLLRNCQAPGCSKQCWGRVRLRVDCPLRRTPLREAASDAASDLINLRSVAR